MLFVAEVFDGFVVEQAVDGAGVGAVVLLVHHSSKFDAPFRNKHRVSDVNRYRDDRNERHPDVQRLPQDNEHQSQLEHGRHDTEEAEAEQNLDGFGAALYGSREPSGLAGQVKLERQEVQMAKHLQRDGANGALADLGKQCIAKLSEGEGQYPGGAVGENHPDGEHQRHRALPDVQGIDGITIEEWQVDYRYLGRHQAGEGEHHPGAQSPLVLGPQIGQETAQRPEAAERGSSRGGLV